MRHFKFLKKVKIFLKRKKIYLWSIFLTLLSLLALMWFRDFFIPLTTAMSTIAIAFITYQNYQMQLPKAECRMVMIPKNIKEINPNFELGADFSFFLLVNNTGEKVITLSRLINEQEELLCFITENQKDFFSGYVLETRKCYKRRIFLNPNELEIFKKSKRLYVVSLSNEEYPIPTEDLRNIQKWIDDWHHGKYFHK